MLDKLFKRAEKKKETAPAQENQPAAEDMDDALDETGTFMLDVNQLKECEDLEDLLNDV